MKKINSDATWTRKQGSECRMEIREPFASGIQRYRGIEAIQQNPPRRDKGALESRHSASEIQPEASRLKTCKSSLRLRLEKGQAQRSTGDTQLRCTEGQFGCETPYIFLSRKSLEGRGRTSTRTHGGMCYRLG